MYDLTIRIGEDGRTQVSSTCEGCGKVFWLKRTGLVGVQKSCSKRCRWNPVKRFWSNVSKSAHSDGCWNWMGGKLKFGYGRIKVVNREHKAHVFSWILHRGHIPKGMLICHKCDNPSCVNPDHLYLGTYKTNAADRNTRGRNNNVFGDNHGRKKLNSRNVRIIRTTYKRGSSDYGQYALAKRFGVSQTTIGFIVRNETWRRF